MTKQGTIRLAGSVLLAMALMAGCKSKLDQAMDDAKKQAAATGQPQQVVSVDKDGNTTTTTIQPPAPGQTAETISSTTMPAATLPPGTPPPAAGVYYSPIGTTQQAQSGVPAPAAAQGESGVPTATPAPVIRPAEVRVPAGTTLAIRINQHISVKTTPAGSSFDGELAEPYTDESGRVILPQRTPVEGVVDVSHARGHFKGASILELRLTAIKLNGRRYPLATHDMTETKKGKGKRSAAFIGGGAGLGALIGGLAGGGKGALIGGAAGAGAGTAGAGLTGNRDLEIPSESVVHFKLAEDLTLQG
ncbi:MAG TPA: hypothetical protein VII58_14270 [Acidobacteriaceae bacterium]